MKASVEVITPAFAKQLLEQNPHNRPLTRSTVDRYASDMKSGRWNNNGQGIVLTPDGMLLDGQHRMAAVVQAQTPIAMLVVRGVPREAFVTMDSGKPRTLADVLGIGGYRNTSILASIAPLSFNYAAGVSIRYNTTKPQLEAFISQHPYMANVASQIGAIHKLQLPKSSLGAVMFLANEGRAYDTEVAEFLDGVATGAGLWKGDARLTLREWFINIRDKDRGRIVRETAFAAIARAWNAYAEGKELLVIRSLSSPNLQNLKVVGFDRAAFPDVPNLYERKVEVSRSNLAKARATPPLRFTRDQAAA